MRYWYGGLCLIYAFLLSACGQKGPLTLPQPEQPSQTTPAPVTDPQTIAPNK